ncbi:Exodeoxyribonuclease OS=Bacillus subtilis (strain 168) GN=exoA PE=1 SV=1 [Rhizoctonia solani AG-1 IB]|uniref:DNA-(apurinic or apyrimidinic site) endonuclease n=1 Tax=Thanatephorus cucumeris (strain AG1-IB / isolate 7/3/14) TaxID=1108050 RepID=A0A0B7F4E5_THACB|nr:Exodeoxyribonuclease OS=Bacillus subtilis (strain 168) GN=exoA PE=1 SV=1 [Rhizoctonia solani AG-1 IB]
MPPKRGTKRATSPDEETKSRPSVKRSKSSTNSDVAGYPWTNKGIPDTLTFTPSEEKIRISAWNVCGLTACWKKGFNRYIEAEDADIIILTETKVNDRPTDPLLAKKYPHQYWNIAAKKGYAGTAVLSKHKPISHSFTLDSSANIASGAPKLDQDDVKGRLVTLEFEKCWVIGTYVPNAGEGLKNMDRKVAWQVAFEAHLRNLDAIKPVIWAGDLNVAPTAKDLRNDKSNWNKTAGYTEQETSAFKRALAGPPAEPLTKAAITESTEIAHITSVEGEATEVTKTVKANVESSAQGRAGPMIDIWRRLHPDDEHYTYFSYRFNARLKGMGWRIDHFVTSERFFPKVAACEIRNEIWGASDHCPIVMDFEGPL